MTPSNPHDLLRRVVFGAALCGLVSASAAEVLLERQVDDRYNVAVQFVDGQLQRSIWPKFPIAIELTGSDGRTYTMRQPFDLYTETRTYGPAEELDLAYEDAYAGLVANGECLPVYAGVHEAVFDCGERQGTRTIAVRSDQIGSHLSVEMTATGLIPNEVEFRVARDALDALTSEIPAQMAGGRPAENGESVEPR